jgi:hypothetical protein
VRRARAASSIAVALSDISSVTSRTTLRRALRLWRAMYWYSSVPATEARSQSRTSPRYAPAVSPARRSNTFPSVLASASTYSPPAARCGLERSGGLNAASRVANGEHANELQHRRPAPSTSPAFTLRRRSRPADDERPARRGKQAARRRLVPATMQPSPGCPNETSREPRKRARRSSGPRPGAGLGTIPFP